MGAAYEPHAVPRDVDGDVEVVATGLQLLALGQVEVVADSSGASHWCSSHASPRVPSWHVPSGVQNGAAGPQPAPQGSLGRGRSE